LHYSNYLEGVWADSWDVKYLFVFKAVALASRIGWQEY
jgi:hypothetical protein